MAHHLAEHPEDRRVLLENPELRPQAVEEFIRYYSAVGFAGRVVMQDTELAGQQFKAGEWVALGYASASKDATVFDDPGRIDIFREGVNRHASFGFGPHRCLGEHLARREIGLTLDALLTRLPEFRIRPGSTPQFETGISRSMKNLDLVWDV
jgi:cytochrome P450